MSEGTGIKEGEGEDGGPLCGKAVERGGKEGEEGSDGNKERGGRGRGTARGWKGEGRDGNKGRGGRGWGGPLRGMQVERGGEEGKRRRNGDVSRLRPSSYSLLCV